MTVTGLFVYSLQVSTQWNVNRQQPDLVMCHTDVIESSSKITKQMWIAFLGFSILT